MTLREKVAKLLAGWSGHGEGDWEEDDYLLRTDRILALVEQAMIDNSDLRKRLRGWLGLTNGDYDDLCRAIASSAISSHSDEQVKGATTVMVRGKAVDVADFDPSRRWKCRGCGMVFTDDSMHEFTKHGEMHRAATTLPWCGPVEEVKDG
jgi:hypothetical protein